MSKQCDDCDEHTLGCRCRRRYISNEADQSMPMNESFWATAYEKFDRWKRAQWLFYTMISK